MSTFEIAPGSNRVPENLIQERQKLIERLFGPSLANLESSLIDDILKRRIDNQIKILGDALKLLNEEGLTAQKIPLKVLAPLVELSSYEEEESLQTKWAYLTANALTGASDTIFLQNCITILNRISSHDARLLDTLQGMLQSRREDRFQTFYNEKRPDLKSKHNIKRMEDISLTYFAFGVAKTVKDLTLDRNQFEFSISNLVALGLLKWDTDVEIDAEKSSDDPEDKDIDVNVNVYNNDYFIFTSLGDKFVSTCKKI